MDILLKDSIIKLDDDKNYIVVDIYIVDDKEYIILISEEEHENEMIYILRKETDLEGNDILSSISEKELLDVQEAIYLKYYNAGVIKNGKVNFEKLYELSNNPELLDKNTDSEENREKQVYINNKNKLNKAKDLLLEYQKSVSSLQENNKNLKESNERLKESNKYLQDSLNKLPKFIRMIFIKKQKLLK